MPVSCIGTIRTEVMSGIGNRASILSLLPMNPHRQPGRINDSCAFGLDHLGKLSDDDQQRRFECEPWIWYRKRFSYTGDNLPHLTSNILPLTLILIEEGNQTGRAEHVML
jgi:hypothetical protein